MNTQVRWERARRTIRMRPVLKTLNFSDIEESLEEIVNTVDEAQYVLNQGDETLLDALDGDEELAYEFRMMFSDLASKVEDFREAWNPVQYQMEERDFDDCVCGLLGNRYKPMYGYFDEGREYEDYRSLMDYEAERAETDAGKRLMRLTKSAMIERIGLCLGIVLSYTDLKAQYENLNGLFEILQGDDVSYLKLLDEIDAAYKKAEEASEGFRYTWGAECAAFNRLLEHLPDRAWVE